MCVCVFVWLYISEMNDRNDTRDRKEEPVLLIFCYYKVLMLPVKWYNIISKWSWISGKYILQILEQPEKNNNNCSGNAKKEETMESYKMFN